VLELTQTRIVLELTRPGRYRLAVRFSPYWQPSAGCVLRRKDGMVELAVPRGGKLVLRFDVNPGRALRQVTGGRSFSCADVF
jgi:hypothetical protein